MEIRDRELNFLKDKWRFLLVGLVFIAGALLIVGPALFSEPRTVVGHENSDVWSHLWGFWWVKDTVSSGGSFFDIPWRTELINYPKGGILYFIDLMNATLSIPLQHFVSVETSYNLLIGFEVFLLGVAGYLLGSDFSKSRTGGLASGLLLQMSPFILGEIHNGISEVINVSWCLIYIHFLLTLERDRWRPPVAGVALFLSFMGNWYFGLSSLIVTALYLVWKEGRGLVRFWKNPFCRRLCLALAVAFLLTAPMASRFYSSINHTDSIVKRSKIPDKYVFLNEHNLSDVLNYVRWDGRTSPDLKLKFNSNYLHLCTLGPLALMLAVLGSRKKKKDRGFWWLVIGVFFVLSAGAYFYIDNSFVRIGTKPVKLPFYYLSLIFPPIALISHPHRFSFFVITAVAVLAGRGMKRVTDRVKSGIPRLIAAICILAVLIAEAVLLSAAPFPMSTSRLELPAFYGKLSGTQGAPRALIDLPMAFDPFILNNRYFYYQIYHRMPIPYTLNDPLATYISALENNCFTLNIHDIEYQQYRSGERTFYREELIQAGLKKLREDGFGHILLHRDYYQREVSFENLRNYLTRYLGNPMIQTERFMVFAL